MRNLITASLLAFSLISCTSAPEKPNAPGAESNESVTTAIKIIDVHTHNHFSGEPEPVSGIPDTKEQFLKELKEANAVAAVVHVGRSEKADVSMKAQGAIHCAGLNASFDERQLDADLKGGTYNCIKVYLGYVHQWASHPNYVKAYKLAEKHDVPVVFHTGDTYSTKAKLKYTDPMTVDEVAVDFPKVKFVIAHCGNPWYVTAAEIAYKNPNVYLECSAMLIGDLTRYSEENLQKLMIQPIRYVFDYVENPKKMMFGTDWPLVGIKEYAEVYKRAIPREHWQAVFHDNAVEIFKLKPVSR